MYSTVACVLHLTLEGPVETRSPGSTRPKGRQLVFIQEHTKVPIPLESYIPSYTIPNVATYLTLHEHVHYVRTVYFIICITFICPQRTLVVLLSNWVMPA